MGKLYSKMSPNSEPSEESDTISHDDSSIDDPALWERTQNYEERRQAEGYHFRGYPTPVLSRRCIQEIGEKEFSYTAFLSFGLGNFVSYAAHFCKYEARNKAEIISVGSGNGMVDREIILTYRKHFGEEIKITLVDPDPDYEVDFKTVGDLIEARPQVVGNCILLIIWPEPYRGDDNTYDIDAVRKLQPLAALVLYDPIGTSGSIELLKFLDYRTERTANSYKKEYDESTPVELKNYAVEKVTGLEVYLDAGPSSNFFGLMMPNAIILYSLRLRSLKKLHTSDV